MPTNPLPTVPPPHGGQPVLSAGAPLESADRAMILVHGRGATAASILTLADVFERPSLAYLAPQASGNTWYPYSFLSPMENNEPGISSGLALLAALVTHVEAAGVGPERIMIGGFSQGACLASEFVARNPRRYGGLVVFSGGLIGPPGTPRAYPGDLAGLPVFIGCSDNDFHIPEARVTETAEVLTGMGADVTKIIYPNMGHTVIDDEIEHARAIIDQV